MGGVTDRHSAIFVLCPLRADAVEKAEFYNGMSAWNGSIARRDLVSLLLFVALCEWHYAHTSDAD
jgi:hypothetical protein